MKTLTEEQYEIIEDAALSSCPEADIRTDYSGRGMYGDECIGITLENASEFSVALLKIYDEDPDLGTLLAKKQALDAMGLGVIIYFPGVKAPESEDEA
jgi:hypothetical protein